MQNYGVYQRGETITLKFDVTEGLASVAGVPTAQLKRIYGAQVPGSDIASLANLVVTPVDAVGSDLAGWLVTVSPAVTSTLDPGFYGTDLRIALGSGIYKTETVRFLMIEAITT